MWTISYKDIIRDTYLEPGPVFVESDTLAWLIISPFPSFSALGSLMWYLPHPSPEKAPGVKLTSPFPVNLLMISPCSLYIFISHDLFSHQHSRKTPITRSSCSVLQVPSPVNIWQHCLCYQQQGQWTYLHLPLWLIGTTAATVRTKVKYHDPYNHH